MGEQYMGAVKEAVEWDASAGFESPAEVGGETDAPYMAIRLEIMGAALESGEVTRTVADDIVIQSFGIEKQEAQLIAYDCLEMLCRSGLLSYEGDCYRLVVETQAVTEPIMPRRERVLSQAAIWRHSDWD